MILNIKLCQINKVRNINVNKRIIFDQRIRQYKNWQYKKWRENKEL